MDACVLYDYVADQLDELTIHKGDIVRDVSVFEDGWFIGTINNKQGVFPDNFVKIINNTPVQNVSAGGDPNIKMPLEKVCKKASSDMMVAHFDYTPEEPDELELRVNDVILVLDKDLAEEGWWRGRNISTNKVGIFPDNFVKSMEHLTGDRHKLPKYEPVVSVNEHQPKKGEESKASTDHVIAISNFTSEQSNDLDLRVDDVIIVLDRDIPYEGWWQGRNLSTNKVGVFPCNFVSPLDHLEEGGREKLMKLKLSGLVKDSVVSGSTSAMEGKISDQRPATKSANTTSPRAQTTAAPTNTKQSSGLAAETNASTSSQNAPVSHCLPSLTSSRPLQPGKRPPTKFAHALPISQKSNSTSQAKSVLANPETTRSSVAPLTHKSESTSSVAGASINGALKRSSSRSLQNGGDKASPERTLGKPVNAQSVYKNRASSATRNANVRQEPGVSSSSHQNKELMEQEARSRQQVEDIRHQVSDCRTNLDLVRAHVYQQNEQTNSQLQEMQRQIDLLQKMQNTIRSEMFHSQKALTNRLHKLTLELDESQKRRAADSIELSRVKTLLMQLDAKSLYSAFHSDEVDCNLSSPVAQTDAAVDGEDQKTSHEFNADLARISTSQANSNPASRMASLTPVSTSRKRI